MSSRVEAKVHILLDGREFLLVERVYAKLMGQFVTAEIKLPVVIALARIRVRS